MIRDPNGNYWPEPADLEQGCPACGAHQDMNYNKSSGDYLCGSRWTENLNKVECAKACKNSTRLLFQARGRLAAMERAIKVADKIRKEIDAYYVWSGLHARVAQYDAARAELEMP